jgi:hypothetical protein
MRRLRIAGFVAALALAGCGEDTGVTEGTLPFKSGNVDQLAPMKNQMNEIVKAKMHTKRAGEGKAEAAPTGEAKPSAAGKSEEKKP